VTTRKYWCVVTNAKSYIFQFISVLFSFVNVKLTLDFLGDEGYSTWLVIFSIAGLIYALDFGIGSSVRNRLARLVAQQATPKTKAKLVFTYYQIISVIAIGFCLVAIGLGALAHQFGWMEYFGMRTIAALTVLIFADFTTRAHHSVFAGLQQPHSTNFALASIQLFIFLTLFLVLIPKSDAIDPKIWTFSLVVFGGSIAINTLMLLRLNHLVPIFAVVLASNVTAIKFRHFLIHLRKGLPFFLVQFEFAFLGQVSLYFIYSNFPNEVVVQMAIADKVFAPFIILATIMMYPFWSGYTLLMHRGESDRARKLLQRQEFIALVCFPLLFLGILFYDDVVRLWLDRPVESFVFAIFAVLKVFSIFLNSIYSYFMNGVGKLRPQLCVYSIGLLAAVPILYLSSLYQNIYLSLSVTPTVFLVSAVTQRYFVFNVILTRTTPSMP